MEKKIISHTILLFVIFIMTRIFITPGDFFFFSLDPVIFDRSCEVYSLPDETPHLPGYYLHIQLTKAVSFITGSYNSAMIFWSLSYTLAGTLIYYSVFRKFNSPSLSFALALLLLTNPMVWLFSCTDETYPFDLFFSSILIYLAFSRRGFYLIPVLLAAAAGVRQSSPVLMLPLFFYLCILRIRDEGIDMKYFFLAVIGAIAVFFSWFIPMTAPVGGFAEYFALYKDHDPTPDLTVIKNIITFSGYAPFIFCGAVIPVAALLFTRWQRSQVSVFMRRQVAISLVSIIPALSFFLFYHYAKGYFLLIAGQSILLMSFFIKDRPNFVRYIYAGIALQSAVFLLLPSSPLPLEVKFRTEARKHLEKKRFSMTAAGIHAARMNGAWSQTLSYLDYNESLTRKSAAILERWLAKARQENMSGLFHEQSFAFNYYQALRYFRSDDIYNLESFSQKLYNSNNNGFPRAFAADESILSDKYCIGGADFQRGYLSDITVLIEKKDVNCLYKVKPGYFAEYLERLEYYLRKTKD